MVLLSTHFCVYGMYPVHYRRCIQHVRDEAETGEHIRCAISPQKERTDKSLHNRQYPERPIKRDISWKGTTPEISLI